MHKYKVYEVNRDGTTSDTGKIVVCEPPVIMGGSVIQKGTLLKEVMSAYGFEKFIDGYYGIYNRSRRGVDAEVNCFYIYGSCYHEGCIDLWYVKRGE